MNAVENSKPIQVEEQVDHHRREAMLRMAKYTAPAMLALLLTSENGGAQCIISNCL